MRHKKLEVHIPYDRYELLNQTLINSSYIPNEDDGRLFLSFDISNREALELSVEYDSDSDETLARISVYSTETGTCIEYLHEGAYFPWQIKGQRREIPLEFSIRDTQYSVMLLVDMSAKKPFVLTSSGKKSRMLVDESEIFED